MGPLFDQYNISNTKKVILFLLTITHRISTQKRKLYLYTTYITNLSLLFFDLRFSWIYFRFQRTKKQKKKLETFGSFFEIYAYTLCNIYAIFFAKNLHWYIYTYIRYILIWIFYLENQKLNSYENIRILRKGSSYLSGSPLVRLNVLLKYIHIVCNTCLLKQQEIKENINIYIIL